MKKIISVSRRTDIPAFYGNWFMNRLEQGFAGYINPFYKKKHLVSLALEDVLCFVFWSKNYTPFMEHLKKIKQMGYNCYFHYTINGYPKVFEENTEKLELLIDNLKSLSKLFSPKHVLWRYDPIIISDITSYESH